MKKLLINLTYTIVLLFCNLTNAEQFTVNTANNYPYKNLIERTDNIKIFYIDNNDTITCRVEVVLDKLKWTSAEQTIITSFFKHDPLSHCLPQESAKQLLVQTFIQFGRGL